MPERTTGDAEKVKYSNNFYSLFIHFLIELKYNFLKVIPFLCFCRALPYPSIQTPESQMTIALQIKKKSQFYFASFIFSVLLKKSNKLLDFILKVHSL